MPATEKVRPKRTRGPNCTTTGNKQITDAFLPLIRKFEPFSCVYLCVRHKGPVVEHGKFPEKHKLDISAQQGAQKFLTADPVDSVERPRQECSKQYEVASSAAYLDKRPSRSRLQFVLVSPAWTGNFASVVCPRMKYLDVPELRALYNVFAGREVGNTLLDGKLELFSLKSTQEDKKLKREASRKAEAATHAAGTRATSPGSVSPKAEGVPESSADAAAAAAVPDSSAPSAQPKSDGWRPISADDDDEDFEGRVGSGDESISEGHAPARRTLLPAPSAASTTAGGDEDDGYAPDPLYALGRSRSESLAEGAGAVMGAGAGAGLGGTGAGGNLANGGVPGLAALVAWSSAGGHVGGLAGLSSGSSSGGGSSGGIAARAAPDRRAHLCMIATLNAVFPDYDFSATRPDAFVAHPPAALPAVQAQVNGSLADLAAAEARNPLLPAEIEAATQVLVDSLPKPHSSSGGGGSRGASAGSAAAHAASAAAAASSGAGVGGGTGVGDKRGRSRSGSFSSVGGRSNSSGTTGKAGSGGPASGAAAASGSLGASGIAHGDAAGGGGKRLRRDSSADEPAVAAAAAVAGGGRPPRGKAASGSGSDAASSATGGSSGGGGGGGGGGSHGHSHGGAHPLHLARAVSDGGGDSGAAELQSRASRLASLLSRMRGYGPRVSMPAGTGLVLAAPAPPAALMAAGSGGGMIGAGGMVLGLTSSSSGGMGMGGAERLGSATFTFTDVLWEVLDALIDLPRCELFSYAAHQRGGRDDDGDPLSEGALWSFNVFFLNRAKRRLAFLYVKARSRLAATSALAHLEPDASPAESPRRSQ